MSAERAFCLLVVIVPYCQCGALFQVHLRMDVLKVEHSGANVEAELVKREHAENMLAEERDGM